MGTSFRNGWEKFVKIKTPSDLDCNLENSWIKCSYRGINPAIKGTSGKASFDESQNAWTYKPNGKNEIYRIPSETSLIFIRDKDVNVGGED